MLQLVTNRPDEVRVHLPNIDGHPEHSVRSCRRDSSEAGSRVATTAGFDVDDPVGGTYRVNETPKGGGLSCGPTSAMREASLERTCEMVAWTVPSAAADDPTPSSGAITSPTDNSRVAFVMSLASSPTEAGKARENWQRA